MTYQESIIAATGCTPEEAPVLEEIMRHTIFHSTLDWQTKKQFDKGARDAYDVHLYELGLDNPEEVKRFGKIWKPMPVFDTAEEVLDMLLGDSRAWAAWEKFTRTHKLKMRVNTE